ncbi:hypothetical protein BOTBODRAFT_88783, partial [Botryobasidium botryosum FD-172 SS1]
NTAKIIRHMSYLVENDPTRRFVFGVTIEDVGMQLWYCDRSGYVTSERFNYIAVCILFFVHAFVSLACAKGHHLGFDASMTRISISEEKREDSIEIEVRERVFCTTRFLYNRYAHHVCGRGTRV